MHKLSRNITRSGFTLIELSIVLVIIGLMVGGILVGRDLISQAEARSVITFTEKTQTAINTFRVKYNALPGDMSNATTFWGADSNCPNTVYNTVRKAATCNGNGNGQIGNISTSDYYENSRFWQHLANAGFIPGQYTGVAQTYFDGVRTYSMAAIGLNVPAGPISRSGYSVLGFYCDDTCISVAYYTGIKYQLVMFFGVSPNNDDVTYFPIITPSQAFSIDSKIDDGKPGTGWVLTLNPNWVETPNCATTTSPATAVYNVTYRPVACPLLFNLKQ